MTQIGWLYNEEMNTWAPGEITSGGLPTGGTTGQVLTKQSNADGDAGWENGGSQPWFDDEGVLTAAGPAAVDGEFTATQLHATETIDGKALNITGQEAAEGTIIAGLETGASPTKPVIRLYDADFNNVIFEILGSGAGLFILPSVDPEVAGAIWNDSGTVAVSAG